MRGSRSHLTALAELHLERNEQRRRTLWRQGMATLAGAVNSRRLVPLEGLSPQALRDSVGVAINTQLVDELDFLSPGAAAGALYELAAALPQGREKQDLGRRVLRQLHEGNAETFVELATLLALGARRALSGSLVRARVALCLDMPIGMAPRSDALALALISRPDTQREWLIQPSMGSLPSRRLAARLLERAARESAVRSAHGDDTGIGVFESDAVRTAWSLLLDDRESLVWRHVATARGLLAASHPPMAQEIQRHLDPSLTPTEWRRAAASLVASMAHTRQPSYARARALLHSDIVRRDRGVVSTMVFGLARAAESEPEAAEQLLEHLISEGGLDTIQALLELRRECIGSGFGERCTELALSRLHAIVQHDVDEGGTQVGTQALASVLEDALSGEGEEPSLDQRIATAVIAYASEGPRQASAQARMLLKRIEMTVQALVLKDSAPASRHSAFRILWDLNAAMLQTSALRDLLCLGATTEELSGRAQASLDLLSKQLMQRLVEREQLALPYVPSQRLEDMHRLRTLLHVSDADMGYARRESDRELRLRTVRALLGKIWGGVPGPLERVLCACIARACDALVREDIAEASDVVLVVSLHIGSVHNLRAFAEASMVPDIKAAVHAFADMRETLDAGSGTHGILACLDGLLDLAHRLPAASSLRVQALRQNLLALCAALDAIRSAKSLSDLRQEGTASSSAMLEDALETTAQLVRGAHRRLGMYDGDDAPAIGAAVHLVDIAVDRALLGDVEPLANAVASIALPIRKELPPMLADITLIVMERLTELPVRAVEKRRAPAKVRPRDTLLPAWLPPNRTLGAFFVQRPLGSGASGSVFIARRLEERLDERATRFALKVPEYDGTAARTLSEDEFLRLFREEAGALLSLPHHPNLARFVTFDAGARPKPILVMELVEGPSLERVLDARTLTTSVALRLLDGIAAGLEAMHSVGVGHLDIKPSNVILRDRPDAPFEGLGEPVLVDFGLAGRHLRPGCGTGPYGAPEIWGILPKGVEPIPTATDVYGFGCIAYEVLAGRALFNAPTEMALIAAHGSHDGRPDGIRALGERPTTAPFANWIAAMIKRDPRERITASKARAWIRDLQTPAATLTWPLRAA